MVPLDGTDETLDSHWAVAVIGPEERASLLAFAERAAKRIASGTWPGEDPIPERILPLASAYEFAAREWLDLDGIGNPGASPTTEESATRRGRLEFGAHRAFLLGSALPLEDTDPTGALYHALLLAALAQIAGHEGEFRSWLAMHRDTLFRSGADDRWDVLLLRHAVELWTEILSGTGPSGLQRAMELVATVREERPIRDTQFLAGLDESEEMRLRFYLFALGHLTDAATEVLLYRLHGKPEDVRYRVFVSLSLAREATLGDARMYPPLEWLYEAAVRVIERRTPQLELLPESELGTRVHS